MDVNSPAWGVPLFSSGVIASAYGTGNYNSGTYNGSSSTNSSSTGGTSPSPTNQQSTNSVTGHVANPATPQKSAGYGIILVIILTAIALSCFTFILLRIWRRRKYTQPSEDHNIIYPGN